MKRLENKVAIIYSDGTVGGAIAKSFAMEGAKVFLTGNTITKLKVIADEISIAGGNVEIVQLEALDEKAVEKHLNDVFNFTGRIDISFNAISLTPKLESLSADEWFEKHNSVSAEDFIKEPHRNKPNIIITRTTHLAYHIGQLILLK
jgi:NADP-dependent 3-hydroxy acid dehydrogenase YdfG